MKQILLCCFIFSLTNNLATAQEKKIKESLVPESVLSGYKEKYKKIPVDAWLQDESNYIAAFEKANAKYKASFTSDGTWVQTSTKIKEESVSGAVKKSIKNTEWKDWKLSESYKVETPAEKKIYVLHLKKGKEKKILSFDPTGKALDISDK